MSREATFRVLKRSFSLSLLNDDARPGLKLRFEHSEGRFATDFGIFGTYGYSVFSR
ncbi:MAG TPA: hypothetical protein VHE55_04005 [Fimbriimonadaceae bacterium]|nr:hypothetical protein [Fimbriimonadaceae bacterium]